MFVWEKRSEYKTPTAWNSNGIPCRGQWFQTINVLFRASFALLQILLGGGEHEFDSVELVDFAGTGIVVDGYDVGGRICLPQSLDNALPTTWFGRQPKGWVHTMFGTPSLISSTISPVRNHPSPVWLPMDTIGSA